MEKQLFELMTKMYNEMQEIKSELKEVTSKVTNVEDGQIKIRQDIVRLEDKMDDKLSALFDAREIQIDVDEKVAHNLQRVESKVDKLELRVLRSNLNIPSTDKKIK